MYIPAIARCTRVLLARSSPSEDSVTPVCAPVPPGPLFTILGKERCKNGTLCRFRRQVCNQADAPMRAKVPCRLEVESRSPHRGPSGDERNKLPKHGCRRVSGGRASPLKGLQILFRQDSVKRMQWCSLGAHDGHAPVRFFLGGRLLAKTEQRETRCRYERTATRKRSAEKARHQRVGVKFTVLQLATFLLYSRVKPRDFHVLMAVFFLGKGEPCNLVP